ncbi:unnamed protein product [Cylindrotheca closterium]|uniref:WW domain-containing protein n=1 Tax=Cylindrotheca closterium TaxID=2856 RepID=A0AAD2JH81_9STRA|nr:unnamed protein product [Cylindrotheca closterium]
MTGSALPPGWVEARDSNTGRIYYANPTTEESSWEVPIVTSHQPHQQHYQQHHQQHHQQHRQQHQQQHHQQRGIHNNVEDAYYLHSQEHPSRAPLAAIVKDESSTSRDNKSSLLTMARELTVQQAAAAAANSSNHSARHYSPQNQSDLELYSITCGQLVDLIHMQAEVIDEAYMPINPYNIPDQKQHQESTEPIVALLNGNQSNNGLKTICLRIVKKHAYQSSTICAHHPHSRLRSHSCLPEGVSQSPWTKPEYNDGKDIFS